MAVGTRLESKFAVVTGAAGGIGRAVVKRFLEEGASVACIDLDWERVALIPDDWAVSTLRLNADVANEESVDSALRTVLAAFAGIDVLCNCAGIAGPQEKVGETSVEDWDLTQAVNLRGTFIVSKACVPELQRRSGNIVNIASALAFVGWPKESAYGPSKAGVVQLTKGMALDYAPAIRVNCVCPGAVRTPMITSVVDASTDLEEALAEYGKIHPLYARLADPSEIADAVLFLASNDASFITGVALPVDGGFLCS